MLGRRVPGLYYGWWIVFSSSLTLYAAYGVQYSFGVFLPFIAADLSPGNAAIISLVFAIYASLYSVLAFLSGKLTDRWGPGPVFALGGLLLGLGIVLASRSTTMWQFFMAYGLVAALGMSTVFVPATATAVRWFSGRRGLAVGIVVAGSSLGQLTIPMLSYALIDAWSWRTTYLVYGVALAVVVPILSLWLKRDPESMGLKPYGAETNRPGSQTPVVEGQSLRPLEAMRTAPFWLLSAALFLVWIVVFLPAVHLPSFARNTLGSRDSLAVLTVMVLAAGTGSGRIMGGHISDFMGRRRTFVLVLFLALSGFIGLSLASVISSLPLTYASTLLLGLGQGGVTAVYPAFAADLFGRTHAGAIVGLIFSIAGASSGVGVYLAGAIFQATGSYTWAFLTGAGVTLAAIPLLLAVRPRARLLT